MFEKETEEYSNNWRIPKRSKLNFAEVVELKMVIYKAHNDGVNLGYNKANEWHYPSKGEYPKVNGNVLLWCEPKFKEQHTKGGCLVLGYWSDSRFVQFSPKNGTIIAWKEITFPELKEIEE